MILVFQLCNGFFIGFAQTDSVRILSEIVVRGNATTKPHVIFREMALKKGDTLTPTALEHDRNQIYNLGLFNSVELTTSNDTLYIDVVERWYFFPFPVLGFQYNDFNKVYYGFGIIHNNVRGRNEKFTVTAGWGYDRWFSVEYYVPNITWEDDYFFSSVLSVQKTHNLSANVGEYTNDNLSVRCSIGKRFGLYQRLNATLGYDVWKVSEPRVGRTLTPSGNDAFPVLGLHYRYDTRNNNEYTTDGTLVKCTVTKYGLSSNAVNLVHYQYDVRVFTRLGAEGGVGIRSAGSFIGGGNCPPYLRVFYGYSERIRGHYFDKYEGEGRVSVSSEVRLPILAPRTLSLRLFDRTEFTKMRYGLYWAFFADAGKIWYRPQRIDRCPLLAGYGGGFHILLPYAVCIRVEAAVNEKRESEFYCAWDVSF